MTKKFFLLVVAILMGGMTAVKAKINYVPLYIVNTSSNVRTVKHSPSVPLFITQDNYRLILPQMEESLTFKVYKDDECIHQEACPQGQATVNIPSSLVGDYEVRLSADTYYYYGYITLGSQNGESFPSENSNWDNITLLGSNTSQQAILDNIMGLNVVEYNMKVDINEDDLIYLSEEDKEAYIKQREEIHN